MTTRRKQTIAASLATRFLAVLIGGSMTASAQTTFTWANANVTGTPTSPLDWYTGGDNDQGTWTDGDPVGADDTTIQIFENTTTALPNTANPSTQTVNLNNGGNAFELGTLTLSGRGSATANANLTMTLSGDDLNFSASSGTINLNAVNATRTITYDVNHAIQLGTASSSSTLSLTGSGNSGFSFSGGFTELSSGSKLVKSGPTATISGPVTLSGGLELNGGGLTISGPVTVSGGLEINGGTLALTHGANAITGGIVLNGGQWNNVKATDSNNNPITVNGAFTFFGNTSISGALTLNANLTAQRGTFTFNGPITGSGGLTVNADGSGSTTTHLNSTDNTFTGALVFMGGRDNTINVRSIGDADGAGNIRFTRAPSFDHQFNFTGTAPLTLNHRQFEIAAASASRFKIRNQSAEAFTINTDLSVTGTGERYIHFGGTGAGLSTFAGNIGDGDTADFLAVRKIDSGTWVFSGNNTYSGTTTVSAGTLMLAGSRCLADENRLTISGTGKVQLDAGVKERVGSLMLGETLHEGPTTWGASSSTAENTSDTYFVAGDGFTGVLYVGMDPPSGGTVILVK